MGRKNWLFSWTELGAKHGVNERKVNDEQRALRSLKVMIETHFGFLIAECAFSYCFQKYLGRAFGVIILENEFLRIRFTDAGEFGGLSWEIGNPSEELIPEKGGGWFDLLNIIHEKFGISEKLPDTGRKTWEPYPFDLWISFYYRVLKSYLPMIIGAMKDYHDIQMIPSRRHSTQ